jgi:hypothetical protein
LITYVSDINQTKDSYGNDIPYIVIRIVDISHHDVSVKMTYDDISTVDGNSVGKIIAIKNGQLDKRKELIYTSSYSIVTLNPVCKESIELYQYFNNK